MLRFQSTEEKCINVLRVRVKLVELLKNSFRITEMVPVVEVLLEIFFTANRMLKKYWL